MHLYFVSLGFKYKYYKTINLHSKIPHKVGIHNLLNRDLESNNVNKSFELYKTPDFHEHLPIHSFLQKKEEEIFSIKIE